MRNNPAFIDTLLSDKRLQEKFAKMLRPGVTTGLRDELNDFFTFSFDRERIKYFRDLGFDENTAQQLEKIFEN